MNLQQLQSLTLSDCLVEVSSRIILPEGEVPTQAQLEAEFLVYKQELIDAENARLAEQARIDDLKARFEAMPDHGLLQSAGIQNPAKHFQDSVLKAEPLEAEAEMCALEHSYSQASAGLEQAQINAEALAYLASTDWLILREADCSEPCPEDIKQARAEARAKIIR